MRKIIMTQLSDLKTQVYIYKILVGGKIGIGVILYEKGKGKFVGDWKTRRTRIFYNNKKLCSLCSVVTIY